MTDEAKHFVVNDIPPEWRMQTESIVIPKKPLPDCPLQSLSEPAILTEQIKDDFSQIPTVKSTTEYLLDFSHELLTQMEKCISLLESAEQKRREVLSGAELLNGVCNSQITDEQRLSVFVNGIDKFLIFYDNLERIYIDFKSPGFTVLSPDFSSDVRKISEGIKFFELNSHFRESKLYRLRYVSLQNKSIELVSDYIKTNLERAVILSKNADPYQKFSSIAPSIKRLFHLIEGMPRLFDALNVYRKIRFDFIKPLIKYNSFESSLFLIIDLIQKEQVLATQFFDFEKETYLRSFSALVGDIIDYFQMFYAHELYNTNDVVQLCQYCSIFKDKRTSSAISKINYVSKEIERRLNSLFVSTQERIISIIPIILYDIVQSEETIRYLILLYNALSREQFCEPAFQLVSKTIKNIEEKGKSYKGNNEIERDSYLLGQYFTLKTEIDAIGKELDGDVIEFWNLLHPSQGNHLALMLQLESAISHRYQSLGSEISQFILNPLFNLKARKTFGKQQILSAVEGVSIAINTFYKDEIVPQLKKFIYEEEEKASLLKEIQEQLTIALGDCISSFPDMDDESMKDISEIRKQIQDLSL